MVRRFLLVQVLWLLPACFDASPGSGVGVISCAAGSDCPGLLVCFADRCVSPEAPCIDVSGKEAVAQRDGNVCGAGAICVAGDCVAPRCGDGVVSEGEACDEGAANSDEVAGACRTTCVEAGCGDGVIDPGEVCDGAAGCRADCLKVEVCGDGIVDTNEACDDRNENPVDGCDACRLQTWAESVVVSGRIEGRVGVDLAVAGPAGVATDAIGRVFVADTGNHRVRRLDPDGTSTTVAGDGTAGLSGDGGPATSAQLNSPTGVAVDGSGRLFIADMLNDRIRRVDIDGVITTIAGSGPGFSPEGDGGPATSALLNFPTDVAVDGRGRVFIADLNNGRIRRVDEDGIITSVVGEFDDFFGMQGIAIDRDGRLFIADAGNGRIARLEPDGSLRTVVGDAGGDDPATSTGLTDPIGVAVDDDGRIFIVEYSGCRVLRADPDGSLTVIAGTGVSGFGGDDGAAPDALVDFPSDVAVDAAGDVFIADTGNNRVRRVDREGIIRTVVGTGSPRYAGEGGPATSAELSSPAAGLTLTPEGALIIADPGEHRIRAIDADGIIRTLAGTGRQGDAGDGGRGLDAELSIPTGVFLDEQQRLYIVDKGNHALRRLEPDGTIVTIAGNGRASFSGDGGPAREAGLLSPSGVALDAQGRIYIADTQNSRVRRVALDGTIDTVAGSGSFGSGPDGVPATSGGLTTPVGVLIDQDGRLLILDEIQGRVRRVESDGTYRTIVGIAGDGFGGDGGPATAAQLNRPRGFAMDSAGRLFIADTRNRRVRRVDLDGTIQTIAGNGLEGVVGDGGPAVEARLVAPASVAVDADGRVFINDGRIRRVDLDGTITTIGGPAHPPGPGALDAAQLYAPRAFVQIHSGRVLSVGDFGRALEINVEKQTVSVVIGADSGGPQAARLASLAPLLRDARGAVVDPTLRLLISEHAAGALRAVDLDVDGDGEVDDASRWTISTLATGFAGPSGLAYDVVDDSFLVVEEADHCIQRIDRDGTRVEVAFGRCGTRGAFPGLLDGPTHVTVSPNAAAFYVADTGNHRVLRIESGVADVAIGDGSVSSAGEGVPARQFPVNAPRQLAIDAIGNLYVTSTQTIRLVANVDGDADADGDDRAFTLFGGGDRSAFPASDALCLSALVGDDDGAVFAGDACQGFMVRLSPVVP